jgi:uncharacterized membrane protein YdbT with pleckstrin-like domain
VPPQETDVWRGSPSQTENLPYLIGVTAILVALTIAIRLFVSGGVVHVAGGTPASPAVSQVASTSLLVAWVLGLLSCLRRVLATRAVRYRVTSQRILVTTGLLSTTQEEIELRRIRDMTIRRPLLQRLFGLGSIVITGVDMSTPREALRAVPNPEGLRDRIREAMNAQLREFGVKMVDFT